PSEIRYIEYDNGNFKPYSSGTNAQEINKSGEIDFNRIYFLGEFATIDEWKIENRWKEVINKDLGNEYFPYSMIISDGITSYKNSYEFNVEVDKPELQNKMKFYVYDKNFNKLTPIIKYVGAAPPAPHPFIAVNDMKEKYIVPLDNEGYNWLGFYFVDEEKNWVDFQWIEIFVDTKLQLTADKYIINPGDTVHIEASMSTGIDFPDLNWTINKNCDSDLESDLDNELEDDFIDNTICINSKTCDYTANELGMHMINASNPLSNLNSYITITVTDDVIEEHDPIPEEESHIAQGTYNCSFWLSAYEAVPFENFESGLWGTADQKRQQAVDSANYWTELYTAMFGEITYDKEDFQILIHDDGTCDVTFSTFLYVNSNSKGISNAPFNGGNIRWTAAEGAAKFEGNVILSLTDDSVKMKGSITKKSPENQFMFNETKTYFFEGEKIY
ncbi:MAG: hypothetical protein KAH05_09300, partial [Clostridiales bacterium]|nr:hypothetical protein [Clostridiales bacterium]